MEEAEEIPLFFTLIPVLALLSNYDRENCLINVGTEGASESQRGGRGIEITSCLRLGTVATAENPQETFMARYTELTELVKPRAQFGKFLERYPQVREQNRCIRWLSRFQAYLAARLCRASARW